MKNLFFVMAFMLVGSFMYGNSVEDFPKYDSSMYIAELDCQSNDSPQCSASCTFSSCSGSGSCTCSCRWFRCNCSSTGELKEEAFASSKNSSRVSMSKDQYDNTKKLAYYLESRGDIESFKIISEMIINLADKKYSKFHENRSKLMNEISAYNEQDKSDLNVFLASINAEERV